ncbi:FimD/PapC N-terminal domain-containing protein, partial [Escherichia coli]|uniref:FimD/PapC N-terminal domain-containing protein n=2 Tax=Escherichia coli TaxID=562 RepID=UPI003F78DDF8
MCRKKTVAESASSVYFRRAALALAVSASFASATGVAGEKLDMSFIQGGAEVNPEVWAALNGSYAPGRYLVDLSLNGKEAGKQILDVTPQDSNELCLTEAWLTKAGIYVSADYFREGYDATRQCYVLTKAPSVKVDFDVSTQSLALSIPQKGLLKMPENVDWDYGTSAFRVNYNANANTGRNNTSAFGSADLKANIGRWVVSSSATASGGDSGNNSTKINMFTATRAIRALSADLTVGKTSTGDSLNLGWSGSRNARGENNWSASASMSVPFTLFDRRYSSSTSVSTSKGGGTGFSTGISGSLNDRFSYGLGGGGVSSYLNASYSGDRAYLSGALNHSQSGGTSGSVS